MPTIGEIRVLIKVVSIGQRNPCRSQKVDRERLLGNDADGLRSLCGRYSSVFPEKTRRTVRPDWCNVSHRQMASVV